MLDWWLTPQGLLLLGAAVLAGMCNSIAGGGSFITFPMLILVGLPSVEANATSTLALRFGAFSSAYAYRRVLIQPQTLATVPVAGVTLRDLLALSSISLLGGIVGSLLLLTTPASTFTGLVPYLMLFATVLFILNPTITGWLRAQGREVRLPLVGLLGVQLAISIYGGYFGGGVSILMLAVMNLMGLTNLNTMNGLKSWLGSCMNGVAIFAFVLAQKIVWVPAVLMAVGSMLGGYISATIAQQIPQRVVRTFVIAIALSMTVYLFQRL
jgi:uncharacterized membrane protein YfcA